MDHYLIWVDLVPGTKDLDFVDAVETWLGHLKEKGTLHGFTVQRRKFGFGPTGLGEWFIDIVFDNLAQMDEAFEIAATRTPDVEAIHRAVFEKVTNYKSGLYRDFPDPFRQR